MDATATLLGKEGGENSEIPEAERTEFLGKKVSGGDFKDAYSDLSKEEDDGEEIFKGISISYYITLVNKKKKLEEEDEDEF